MAVVPYFFKCCLRVARRIFCCKRLIILMLMMPLVGCSSFSILDDYKVKAWKKGAFTQPGMGWSDTGFETVIRDHIFFSKEAAVGRPSLSGGGCGCN